MEEDERKQDRERQSRKLEIIQKYMVYHTLVVGIFHLILIQGVTLQFQTDLLPNSMLRFCMSVLIHKFTKY